MKINTTRFSDKVEDYVKYRPKYPAQILELLREEIGLDKKHVIADIGSGTGFSSELFIANDNKVFAVEPNNEMRIAAERNFSGNQNFISINGSAEKTGLQKGSVDMIFCGQAFHWFDKILARTEFERILKPHGHIVLAWNERDEKDNFQEKIGRMLNKNIPEYKNATDEKIAEDEMVKFFSPKTLHKKVLKNFQTFDLDGLKGRLKSSSYFPKSGVEYERLIKEIEELFYRFEENNVVDFNYETNIFWC